MNNPKPEETPKLDESIQEAPLQKLEAAGTVTEKEPNVPSPEDVEKERLRATIELIHARIANRRDELEKMLANVDKWPAPEWKIASTPSPKKISIEKFAIAEFGTGLKNLLSIFDSTELPSVRLSKINRFIEVLEREKLAFSKIITERSQGEKLYSRETEETTFADQYQYLSEKLYLPTPLGDKSGYADKAYVTGLIGDLKLLRGATQKLYAIDKPFNPVKKSEIAAPLESDPIAALKATYLTIDDTLRNPKDNIPATSNTFFSSAAQLKAQRQHVESVLTELRSILRTAITRFDAATGSYARTLILSNLAGTLTAPFEAEVYTHGELQRQRADLTSHLEKLSQYYLPEAVNDEHFAAKLLNQISEANQALYAAWLKAEPLFVQKDLRVPEETIKATGFEPPAKPKSKAVKQEEPAPEVEKAETQNEEIATDPAQVINTLATKNTELRFALVEANEKLVNLTSQLAQVSKERDLARKDNLELTGRIESTVSAKVKTLETLKKEQEQNLNQLKSLSDMSAQIAELTDENTALSQRLQTQNSELRQARRELFVPSISGILQQKAQTLFQKVDTWLERHAESDSSAWLSFKPTEEKPEKADVRAAQTPERPRWNYQVRATQTLANAPENVQRMFTDASFDPKTLSEADREKLIGDTTKTYTKLFESMPETLRKITEAAKLTPESLDAKPAEKAEIAAPKA